MKMYGLSLMWNLAPKAVNYWRVFLDYIIGVVGFSGFSAANVKRISLACISMESFWLWSNCHFEGFPPWWEEKRFCNLSCMKKATFKMTEWQNVILNVSSFSSVALFIDPSIISNLTITSKKGKSSFLLIRCAAPGWPSGIWAALATIHLIKRPAISLNKLRDTPMFLSIQEAGGGKGNLMDTQSGIN